MSSRSVIGSFLFEGRAGAFMTINAQRYRQVPSKFWTSLKRKLGGATQQLDQQWFQQDGATAHTAGATQEWLLDRFGHWLISRREDRAWSTHSRDLPLLDVFFWGQLKSQVYRTNPGTISDLKKVVMFAVRLVRPETCRAALVSARRRAALYLGRKSELPEHGLCGYQ